MTCFSCTNVSVGSNKQDEITDYYVYLGFGGRRVAVIHVFSLLETVKTWYKIMSVSCRVVYQHRKLQIAGKCIREVDQKVFVRSQSP